MVWLLIEILAFVAAAAVFGGLIGFGLAGSGAKRRAVAFEREPQDIAGQLETYARSHRAVEATAVARAAAEAAARGDLEARLVETEAVAAGYRARAEAAERRIHTMQSPGDSPELFDLAAQVPADAANGGAEAARLRNALEAAEAASALDAQELESLRAQLALAERVRARTEIELAVAQARAQDSARGARGGPPNPDGEQPQRLAAPRGGKADDLRRIKGIGPKNEGVLNALGIYHVEQIAALTPANVAWLDAYLKFNGRVARDDWVGQAKALLAVGSQVADKARAKDAGA